MKSRPNNVIHIKTGKVVFTTFRLKPGLHNCVSLLMRLGARGKKAEILRKYPADEKFRVEFV